MATLETLFTFELIKRSFAVTTVYLWPWRGGARAALIQVAFPSAAFLVTNRLISQQNEQRNKIRKHWPAADFFHISLLLHRGIHLSQVTLHAES